MPACHASPDVIGAAAVVLVAVGHQLPGRIPMFYMLASGSFGLGISGSEAIHLL